MIPLTGIWQKPNQLWSLASKWLQVGAVLPWPGRPVQQDLMCVILDMQNSPLLWEQQGKSHCFQVFVPAHGQALLSKKEQVQLSSLLCHILQNSNLLSTLCFRYFCLIPSLIPAYLGSGLQRFRKKGHHCLSLQGCMRRSLCPSGIHCCSVKPDSLKVFPTAFIFQLVFCSNSI